MALIATGVVFAGVFCFVLLVYRAQSKQRSSIRTRLNIIEETRTGDEVQEPISLPFQWRILKPLGKKLVRFFTGLLPANIRNGVEQKLAQAGNPRGMRAGAFITIVIIGGILFAVAVFATAVLLRAGLIMALLYSIAAILGSIIIASLWLVSAVDRRVREIDRALPDAIDLLVVSVEAGLGFDLALVKVTEKMQGPLTEEFRKALQEMRMGKPRQAALRDLSRKVGSHHLATFISMVIQGTQMGITMGQILRSQSEAMRLLRRQRLEEAIMKLPIKMVFPLVLCIFPALLIIIMGPALLQFIKAF
ncbi:MAG: type II secretion system F family protein [Bacillota bacterium]